MMMTPEIARTVRLVRIARAAAEAGNRKRAERAWRIACLVSCRMGGIAGYDPRQQAILFPSGAVAWRPWVADADDRRGVE